MTTAKIVEELVAHRAIGKAPREELQWIATHGQVRTFAQGEMIFRSTEILDGLYIVLAGKVALYVQRSGGLRKMMEWSAGEVSGTLPYSRMTTPPGDTLAEEPVVSIHVPREMFRALTRECPVVSGILVNIMTDRARRFTSADLRDEKMMSLGKLAAGLAHEVNNPASASLRHAQELEAMLEESEHASRALLRASLTPAQVDAIDHFCEMCKGQKQGIEVSGLALADSEDAVAARLEMHLADGSLAPALVRAGATADDLDRLAEAIGGAALNAALRWIASTCSARMLSIDIERVSRRINELVSAVKGFTNMDKELDVAGVDIQRGIRDTVAMLRGKAKQKSLVVSVDVPEGLPPVRGYTAEVNQVWMNLIDNAIDAAPERGHIAVAASLVVPDIIVTVTDDGPGIPAEIRERIFDPFFTTKPVGEGTGLGLDIVRRVAHWHNGDVSVISRPGQTEFRVRLPIGGPG
jgi:signal transduction histidine kinase